MKTESTTVLLTEDGFFIVVGIAQGLFKDRVMLDVTPDVDMATPMSKISNSHISEIVKKYPNCTQVPVTITRTVAFDPGTPLAKCPKLKIV